MLGDRRMVCILENDIRSLESSVELTFPNFDVLEQVPALVNLGGVLAPRLDRILNDWQLFVFCQD